MRSVMVGLMLFLATASVWAGTWRDDFNDGDLNGWRMYKLSRRFIEPDQGNWRVEDGVVIGGDENPDILYYLELIEGTTWSNYTAEVSVKLSKPLEECGVWSGVWLLISPGIGNYYGLSVRRVNARVLARGFIIMGLNMQAVNVTPFETKANRWYRLKIDVRKDGKIQCFIDGEPVSPWFQGVQEGTPGFGTEGLVAMFDDFIVTGPDIPDRGPDSKAVFPHDKLATAWARLKVRR